MTHDESGAPAKKKRRSDALPPPSPASVAAALRVESLTIEWLAGDGSDRCYYRIFSPELKHSLVLMQLSGSDAQALKDDGYDWVKIARVLDAKGIFVPRVVAALPDHAALVIEDYGDVMLEGHVFGLAEREDWESVRRVYRECAGICARFLAIPSDPQAGWCRRSFDAERFVWELNFFLQKYAGPVAGIDLTESERATFADEAQALAEELASGSHYFVHRDFHSRNTMVQDDKLAIIDFQDARLGPVSYDLVSLVFDSYVPFTGKTRTQIFQDALDVYTQRLGAAIRSEVEEQWRPMLLQRQLKAIGSFGFLTLDKQRGDYLKYVSPALRTLEEQGVVDARWPFLSSELIKRMRAHLNATSPER
jgi:aminoglycoside/choline kinase family phosphotransferase